MTNENKPTDVKDETVIEHPEYKRAKAFALYMARCHARNSGKPMPDPDSIQPIMFAKLSPSMSSKEKVEKLKASLKTYGAEVNPNSKTDTVE
jgi:hypothetical protein